MAQRGVYRSIFSALPDDPDFQRLSPPARLVLYTARLCRDAGPSAIFRYYRPVLMAQSGLSAKQLDAALVELEAGRWIAYDGTVLWVRNGLRYDPNITLADPKHKKAVERHLQELPRSPIVLKFCEYYGIARAFEGPSEGLGSPFEAGKGKGSREREPEREPEREGTAPAVVMSDDQFLESLRRNPAYIGIDLDQELGRMTAWLSTPKAKGRKRTRQFIVNWLNRIDRPVHDNGAGPVMNPRTLAAGRRFIARHEGGPA